MKAPLAGLKIEIIQVKSDDFIFVITFFLDKRKHTLSGTCATIDACYKEAMLYLADQTSGLNPLRIESE